MHGFSMEQCGGDVFEGLENRGAAQLFNEMDRLRRVWEGYQPTVPMRRSEIFVLGTMAHLAAQSDEPITVGRLARQMHQSMPGISQKVSMLEKQGHLVRVGDATDRRVVTVELTDKGRATARGEMMSMMARVDAALACLGPDKTKKLLSLMHQLSDALAKEAPAGET